MRHPHRLTFTILLLAGVTRGQAAEPAVTGALNDPPVITTTADGIPLYAFGRTYVLGICPDFEKNIEIQADNSNSQVKFKPKKSRELKGYNVGSMPTQLPRTPANDFQPYQCINLIDGNAVTGWSSRGQSQADVQLEWVRIDLPREIPIKEIRLMPREDGMGVPSKLEVKISRDAWYWTTVGRRDSTTTGTTTGMLSFPLAQPALAKQIWLVGEKLTRGLPTPLERDREFAFCAAEVLALDEEGENAALAARGAAVTVSSTFYGDGGQRERYEDLWSIHYDLGLRWMRLGGWGGTLDWDWVEYEKGRYRIDPRTDAAITEVANNGIKILMILCYGNWLYTEEGKRPAMPVPWGAPAPFAGTPEQMEAYKNYCRFMARHFKGRVACYELWNEGANIAGTTEKKDGHYDGDGQYGRSGD